MVNGFLTFLLFITDSVDLGVIGRRLEDVLILFESGSFKYPVVYLLGILSCVLFRLAA